MNSLLFRLRWLATLTFLVMMHLSVSLAVAASNESAASAAVVELQQLIARDGSVTFRSWQGKMLGTDSDTEITFLPEKTVNMTNYGYVVSKHKGTYHVSPAGEMVAKFDSYRPELPVMLLQKDAASLLLRPKKDSDFVIGNGGGATIPVEKGGYWPFRPVSIRNSSGENQGTAD